MAGVHRRRLPFGPSARPLRAHSRGILSVARQGQPRRVIAHPAVLLRGTRSFRVFGVLGTRLPECAQATTRTQVAVASLESMKVPRTTDLP